MCNALRRWGAISNLLLLLCEQVLFVYVFNGNPAPVIRFMQFHYCTVSNPGTGADDTFVLKHSMQCNTTRPSHSRPVIAASAHHFQICFLPQYFDRLFTYSLFTQSFLCTKPCVIYFGILECLSNVYLDAGSSLISSRCLSRSILFQYCRRLHGALCFSTRKQQ